MGFFSKITRAITKPIKKVIKSPIGRAALLGGLGYLGGAQAGLWGPKAAGSKMGWMKRIGPQLFGSQASNIAGPVQGILGTGTPHVTGILPKLGLTKGAGSMMPTGLGWAGIAGLGTAAAAAGQPEVDELQGFGDEGKGHQAYLNARRYMPFGDESSPHYTAPMWNANQGGRVRAQEGMYAGQGIASLQGAEADMSTVNQPTEQGVLDSGTTDQSNDARLIQLIQQLAALGIPMEQLRGRTEQELVEMMVYMSSQMGNQQGGGRAQMARGGDNSLFLEESSEVIRGGQDGDSVVDETENIEVASGVDWGDDGREELANKLFGKPLKDLLPPELEELELEVDRIRNKFMNKGGIARTAYANGDVVEETENIEVASAPSIEDSRNEMALQLFGKPLHELTEEELMIMDDYNQSLMNKGGIARTAYAMGTEHPVIPSKDGKQLDMRDTGGYQPHGKAEKHDDVRALLAQGEFVMTSDAVKGLGGGDREAGAKKMYDVMHNLEAMA